MAKKKKIQEKDYSIFLDEMIWSYSRVNAFLTCPKCFYLQYIKCKKSTDGSFGQFGTLCHEILEKYAKGKLQIYELSKEYRDNFNKTITCPFPPNKFVDLKDKYFESGLDFFNNFDGYDDSKIIGIENRYDFNVGKYKFVGSIDLEIDDKIIDYKTKSKLGDVTRLSKNHIKENYVTLLDGRYLPFEAMIQLLIYCVPYYNKHGKYPNVITLDMIKIGDKYSLSFNEELLEKAKKWVIDTLQMIYNEKEFKKNEKCDSFWCGFTCSMRYDCEHSDRYVE